MLLITASPEGDMAERVFSDPADNLFAYFAAADEDEISDVEGEDDEEFDDEDEEGDEDEEAEEGEESDE